MQNLELELARVAMMNNRRLKRVEELNMEVTAEPTAEERTQVFKDWVAEKIGVCETFLTIAMHNLDYGLNERKPIADRLFDNKFEFVYCTINGYAQEAKCNCKDKGISDDVLADAVKKFEQMKSKVRKIKAEYKQKFVELKESIREAMENEEYVVTVTSQVQKLITEWCCAYVILDYRKPDFEGDRLSKTIAYVTKRILSTKLYPSDEEVVDFVEQYMKIQTVTVAC